jgi:hypothetical protein
MTTSRTISAAVALAALALTSLGAKPDLALSSADAAPGSAHALRDERTVRPATQAAPVQRHAYRWPLKPFGRQHPVRGFFGDPRIANNGQARQFHFGIDISAPNGTPVYATTSGRVWIHPLHATTVVVSAGNGVEHSYWHVVPSVRTGARAVAHRTVLGHIEAPYGHVHFSESRNGRYLNPLRPGALGPYADPTRPQVLGLETTNDAVVAQVADETPLAVPRPWHDLPVMPALVRWRLLDRGGRAVSGWNVLVDFRSTIPPASEFDRTWAPGAMQNHVRAPGRYRLLLRSLDPRAIRGRQVEVAVSDTRGNASRRRFAAVELLSRS